MAVTGQIRSLVNQFVKANPDATKPRLTSGERTAREQLQIILEPKRKSNYLNIKRRFLAKFDLKELAAYDDLTPEQNAWWISEIMRQAGKPNGFAHVGGKAQDVSLKGLDEEERTALRQVFVDAGWGVLNETVTPTASIYKVPIRKATVLHVFKK